MKIILEEGDDQEVLIGLRTYLLDQAGWCERFKGWSPYHTPTPQESEHVLACSVVYRAIAKAITDALDAAP
jgi:hypothetical protein